MTTLPPLYFPSLVGHLVATFPLPPRGTCAYEYVFAANGIFLRAGNAYFEVQMPVHRWTPGTVRGLPTLAPHLTVQHPRLPCDLLRDIVADARARQDATGQLLEGLYRVVLHEQDGEVTFTLDVPPQQAGVASVTTTAPPAGPVVLELHSHGALAAFWSATDDRDEGGLGLYAVLGALHTPLPEILLRVGVYGYWWEVPVSVLFAVAEPVPVQDKRAAAPAPLARFLPTLEVTS